MIRVFLTCVWIGVVTVSIIGTVAGQRCSFQDIMTCNQPMMSMTPEQMEDMGILCQTFTEVMDCFHDVADRCPTFEGAIEMAMARFDNFRVMCDDVGSSPGCSFRDMMDCNAPLNNMTTEHLTNPVELCPVLTDAFECFQALSEKCPSFKESIEMAMAEMAYFEQTCSGDDGGCSVIGFMTCTARLMEMTDSEMKDLDNYCVEALLAISCLEKETETCPRFLQQQYEMAQENLGVTRAICEYHLDNPDPDPSLCSMDDILQCGAHLDAISEEEARDIKTLCPKLIQAIECTLDEMESCPQSLQKQLRTSLGVLERRGQFCEYMVNTDKTNPDDPRISNMTSGNSEPMNPGDLPDSGDSGKPGPNNPDTWRGADQGAQEGGDCSQQRLMMCAGAVQMMTAEERRNLDAMCPATNTALACLTREMAPCPEVVTQMFGTALTQLKMSAGMCKTHWSAAALNLKANFWIMLVTSLLVVLHHFL